MDALRLMAVDADDLAILSAHCQDAVCRFADCRYLPRERRFLMAMNRFVWEKAGERRGLFARRPREYERRRSVLHFNAVMGVEKTGLATAVGEQVLNLLAIRFSPGEAPSGAVELVFAGGSAIRLAVEVIEAQLTDVGGAWSTRARPDHDRPSPDA